jgi:hypothetical protein
VVGRLSETAARQRDLVLPVVPYRQWVLSLPWALRLPVARDPTLLNAVSRVFFEEVRAWLRAAVGAVPAADVEAAAVTFVQRFGGSLNLNPHLHMLVADGVFACLVDGSAPRFVATAAPTRDELRGVIARVIARLETIAARRARVCGRRRAGGGPSRASTSGARARATRTTTTRGRTRRYGWHRGVWWRRWTGSTCTRGCAWRPTTATGSSGSVGTWRARRWRRGA